MGEIVRWVKNITYYFILIHILFQLLPSGKYQRYIRLFSGIIFVLLAVSPLTRGLKLEEKLAYAFEKIQFEQSAEEFSQRLWGIEEERLKEVLGQYEEAVSRDVRAMAEAEGLDFGDVQVVIQDKREEKDFGQVVRIQLGLSGEPRREKNYETGEAKEAEAAARGETGVIRPVQVQVEVRPGEEIFKEAGKTEEVGEKQKKLGEFQRKVAEYYGLEEKDIRIAW